MPHTSSLLLSPPLTHSFPTWLQWPPAPFSSSLLLPLLFSGTPHTLLSFWLSRLFPLLLLLLLTLDLTQIFAIYKAKKSNNTHQSSQKLYNDAELLIVALKIDTKILNKKIMLIKLYSIH